MKKNKICSFVKYSFCIFFEFYLYWIGSDAETIWHYNVCGTFKFNWLEREYKLDLFIQIIISTLLSCFTDLTLSPEISASYDR